MSNKPTPQALALLVQGEAKTLVPALLQASIEIDADKQHEVLLEVFRKVDTKKNELEIHEGAYNEMVVKKKVMGQIDGKDVVKLEIVKSRNLGYLANNLGRGELAKIIQLLLVNVNNSFNVKEGLTLYQIKEISEQIIDEFGSRLFIDELVYIFKKAKTNAKLFNKIDGSDIFKWIDEHYKLKEYQQMKKDAEHKSEGFDLPQLPKGMMKQAAEKLQDKYISNMISIGQIQKPVLEKKKKKK